MKKDLVLNAIRSGAAPVAERGFVVARLAPKKEATKKHRWSSPNALHALDDLPAKSKARRNYDKPSKPRKSKKAAVQQSLDFTAPTVYRDVASVVKAVSEAYANEQATGAAFLRSVLSNPAELSSRLMRGAFDEAALHASVSAASDRVSITDDGRVYISMPSPASLLAARTFYPDYLMPGIERDNAFGPIDAAEFADPIFCAQVLTALTSPRLEIAVPVAYRAARLFHEIKRDHYKQLEYSAAALRRLDAIDLRTAVNIAGSPAAAALSGLQQDDARPWLFADGALNDGEQVLAYRVIASAWIAAGFYADGIAAVPQLTAQGSTMALSHATLAALAIIDCDGAWGVSLKSTDALEAACRGLKRGVSFNAQRLRARQQTLL